MLGTIFLIVVTAGPRQPLAPLGGSTPDLLSLDSTSTESLKESLGMKKALDGLAEIADFLNAVRDPNTSELLQHTIDAMNRQLEDSSLSSLLEDGVSLLHLAVVYDHVKAIRVLVAAGADLEVEARFEMDAEMGTLTLTPLQLAAGMGCTEAIRALVNAGADIEAKEASEGFTPLHSASLHGHAASLEALLALGASHGAQDMEGDTPLHLAAKTDHTDAIRVLAAAGASLEARNHAGDTPMHHAARNANVEAIRALAEAGASLMAYNSAGETPISISRTLALAEHHEEALSTPMELMDGNREEAVSPWNMLSTSPLL